METVLYNTFFYGKLLNLEDSIKNCRLTIIRALINIQQLPQLMPGNLVTNHYAWHIDGIYSKQCR